jgi:putative transposase
MPEYRRAFLPGGTFFFTFVTAGRAPILATPEARVCLRTALQQTAARWPFAIRAIVLLPDHLHTIWTLPDGDADFSRRWAFLKKQFTRGWLAAGGAEQATSHSRRRNRRRGVWQRRFWEHTIRDEVDFIRHCDYIHYNPVKHGRAECPHAWPYSSFPRFVSENKYAADWQCVCRGRAVGPLRFDDLAAKAME